MSVDLLPSELGFRRPFDREVTETLRLTNTNSTPVAFKVKTTAPKQYCVRPNSGIIQPNNHVEVQVLLQALKEDPPIDFKCRDKFLVQSVSVSTDSEANLPSLWSSIEKTNKGSIQERKIRVNFLPASGVATNGVASHEEQPPAYSSPSPQFGSPAPASSSGIKSEAANGGETTKDTVYKAAEATGVAGAAAAVANAIPSSQEQMKQQLAAANAQISKLTSQLQDPQVRQRKVQEASEKMQTVVQQSQESGVPLQIVAGLCLLSFLIAYLFF